MHSNPNASTMLMLPDKALHFKILKNTEGMCVCVGGRYVSLAAPASGVISGILILYAYLPSPVSVFGMDKLIVVSPNVHILET